MEEITEEPAELVERVAALCQRPGQIVSDTKLALVLNPVRFLSHALHFWNPLADSG